MTNAVTEVVQIAEYTTVVQNVVLAICGVATVVIAYCGLTTWRKELKGKSEYTKAKEVLKAVYKVRRAFIVVRGPGIFSYEYPESMREESGHLKREYEYEGTAHVYQERWKILAEAFQELEDQTLDAQVEWGAEFQDVIVPLRKCRGELQIAIQELLKATKHPYVVRQGALQEQMQERSVLYYLAENSEHDKFTSEINAAIELFENKLRPHIKK
jgi:hypothetical protein